MLQGYCPYRNLLLLHMTKKQSSLVSQGFPSIHPPCYANDEHIMPLSFHPPFRKHQLCRILQNLFSFVIGSKRNWKWLKEKYTTGLQKQTEKEKRRHGRKKIKSQVKKHVIKTCTIVCWDPKSVYALPVSQGKERNLIGYKLHQICKIKNKLVASCETWENHLSR